MFAIYPTVDAVNVEEHAVVFTDDIDIAKRLQAWFTREYGMRHQAYLVTPSWPDALLVNNLNGCPESVYFSTRDPHAAVRASRAVREILGGNPARAAIAKAKGRTC